MEGEKDSGREGSEVEDRGELKEVDILKSVKRIRMQRERAKIKGNGN